MKANSQGHVDANGNPKGHFVMGLCAFFGFQFEIFGGQLDDIKIYHKTLTETEIQLMYNSER